MVRNQLCCTLSGTSPCFANQEQAQLQPNYVKVILAFSERKHRSKSYARRTVNVTANLPVEGSKCHEKSVNRSMCGKDRGGKPARLLLSAVKAIYYLPAFREY